MSDAYQRALSELYALAPRGIEPGLERVRAALEAAGHPERGLRVVHVAGTNGKGSVSAMIATGLAAAGHRVGLYTSPHLASLTERMRVLGAPAIEQGDVVRAWDALKASLSVPEAPRVTFFEALTFMAFSLFRERALDVVVLEVGLGGRLDATNVIERPLACAITRVGIDHQRFLGDDLASIAAEKAGILKPGVPAVIGAQREEAMEAIRRVAGEIGAPLIDVARLEGLAPRLLVRRTGSSIRAGRREATAARATSGTSYLSPERSGALVLPARASGTEFRAGLLGAHQLENAAVALGVLRALEERGLASDVRAALERVEWPGRLERLRCEGVDMLLDAAHNVDGCEALARFLAGEPRKRRVLLFGAMSDKDWRAMLPLLIPHIDELVLSAPALARAERPEVLAQAFGGHAAEHPEHAIALACELAGAHGEVIVAGSIYLMGEVRARVLGLPMDPPIAM